MIRLGLCCIFKEEPIKFRITTAKRLSDFDREEQLSRLSELCLHNALSLKKALEYCAANGIGDFRVLSQINPLRTHPEVEYCLGDLPGQKNIRETYNESLQFSRKHNIRTGFHPDQFIVLSTPHSSVLASSLAELSYQTEIAELIGADVINIHAGGVYGDKAKSLKRLYKELEKLPGNIRARITLENDDRSYTPRDIYPLCRDLGIPLVYDVHHHRCLPDGLSVKEATDLALKTWKREPLFHISSPRDGWNSGKPQFHDDFIDVKDFPDEWRDLDITLEIEAKAKEAAIRKLKMELIAEGIEILLPERP
jgi:UV DNA damage endonuclease